MHNYVEKFNCPCCSIGYYNEGTVNNPKYIFDNLDYGGKAIIIDKDNGIYQCGYCNSEFQVGAKYSGGVKLIKKALPEFYSDVATTEEIMNAIDKFSSVSNVKYDEKSGEISFVNAKGERCSRLLTDVLFNSEITAKKISDLMENFTYFKEELDKTIALNKKLKENASSNVEFEGPKNS